MVSNNFSLRRKDIVVVSILSMSIPIAYNLTKIALPLKLVDVGFSKGIVILPIMIGNFFKYFLGYCSGLWLRSMDIRNL